MSNEQPDESETPEWIAEFKRQYTYIGCTLHASPPDLAERMGGYRTELLIIGDSWHGVTRILAVKERKAEAICRLVELALDHEFALYIGKWGSDPEDKRFWAAYPGEESSERGSDYDKGW